MNRNFLAKEIAEYCMLNLDLNRTLPDDYYYQSLPLCIIDSVFSINANYNSTRNTVHRFCNYFNIFPVYSRERLPTVKQLSISQFLTMTRKYSIDDLAGKIYQNHQRTSTRNGILKAEAVNLFVSAIVKYQVDFFQDVDRIIGNPNFERDIARIPGQGSGITTNYFYMLAGSDEYVKPDRMVLRFIGNATHMSFGNEACQDLLKMSQKVLFKDHPQLTPRTLDYLIWDFQKKEGKIKTEIDI